MAHPLKILIVDDSPEDLEHLRRLLLGRDKPQFELVECRDSVSGLAACRQSSPDCLLLDYRLPGMDGLEFLQELRRRDDDGLPIVMLTGQGDEAVAVAAMKGGAQDYLSKNSLCAKALDLAIHRSIEKINWKRMQREARERLELEYEQEKERRLELEDSLALARSIQQQLLPSWILQLSRARCVRRLYPSGYDRRGLLRLHSQTRWQLVSRSRRCFRPWDWPSITSGRDPSTLAPQLYERRQTWVSSPRSPMSFCGKTRWGDAFVRCFCFKSTESNARCGTRPLDILRISIFVRLASSPRCQLRPFPRVMFEDTQVPTSGPVSLAREPEILLLAVRGCHSLITQQLASIRTKNPIGLRGSRYVRVKGDSARRMLA